MRLRTALTALTILSFLNTGLFAGARSLVNKGNKLYKNNDFEGALEKYKDAEMREPKNAKINFNKGNALYKLGEYENAASEYLETLTGKDKLIQSNALYNLGNSSFKTGKTEDAINFYKKALILNPDDEDIKYNLEYVRYQKQKQDKNKQNQEDKNKKEDKNKEQNKDKDENNDGKKGEDKKEDKNKISKEDAKRILEHYGKTDKDKMKNKRLFKPVLPKVEKDW